MDQDTVEAAHFGGFDEEGEQAYRSRADIMKEVIAKSKYYKVHLFLGSPFRAGLFCPRL